VRQCKGSEKIEGRVAREGEERRGERKEIIHRSGERPHTHSRSPSTEERHQCRNRHHITSHTSQRRKAGKTRQDKIERKKERKKYYLL
jgi:hypothetical protein